MRNRASMSLMKGTGGDWQCKSSVTLHSADELTITNALPESTSIKFRVKQFILLLGNAGDNLTVGTAWHSATFESISAPLQEPETYQFFVPIPPTFKLTIFILIHPRCKISSLKITLFNNPRMKLSCDSPCGCDQVVIRQRSSTDYQQCAWCDYLATLLQCIVNDDQTRTKTKTRTLQTWPPASTNSTSNFCVCSWIIQVQRRREVSIAFQIT